MYKTLRVIFMESDISRTKNSCPTFHNKNHEHLAYVDPLDNVYMYNTISAHHL